MTFNHMCHGECGVKKILELHWHLSKILHIYNADLSTEIVPHWQLVYLIWIFCSWKTVYKIQWPWYVSLKSILNLYTFKNYIHEFCWKKVLLCADYVALSWLSDSKLTHREKSPRWNALAKFQKQRVSTLRWYDTFRNKGVKNISRI